MLLRQSPCRLDCGALFDTHLGFADTCAHVIHLHNLTLSRIPRAKTACCHQFAARYSSAMKLSDHFVVLLAICVSGSAGQQVPFCSAWSCTCVIKFVICFVAHKDRAKLWKCVRASNEIAILWQPGCMYMHSFVDGRVTTPTPPHPRSHSCTSYSASAEP